MKARKTVTLLMAALMSVSTLAACGGTEKSDKTVITLHNNDGGFGTDWLREAEIRFEEKYKDVSFEEGKMGVDVDVEGNRESTPLTSLSTSGYNMCFFEQISEIRDLAQGGDILQINDVLTDKSDVRNGQAISIEDKIPQAYRSNLKGRDGNYYGLPNFEYVPGLTFDQELFDNENLYFADVSETNVIPVTSSYGSANFVANKTAKKHCGNDGIYGTNDDGLPTSLQDMLILCARMKQLSISPFTFTGMHKKYSNLLAVSLWASLAGYEEMKVCYTFDGEMEIVESDENGVVFTNEPLFQGAGLENIKKPKTKTVTITEETGYLINDSAARYYAMAFCQAVNTLGWFSKDSETGTVSHTDAQGNFIFGGTYGNPKIGMLIEGNYWWNETEEKAQNYSTYLDETGKTERKVAWMSLPTSLNGARPTEGNANDVCYVEIGASYAIINANIKDKPGILNACKEFMKFLYTDAELVAYTNSIGTDKALVSYEVSDEEIEKMDYFTQSFQKVVKKSNNAKILYAASYNDNATFLESPASFKIKKSSIRALDFNYNNVPYESIIEAFRAGANERDCFESTRFTTEDWSSLYKGNK